MVKIGFICEGVTEQILLQSDSFKQFLQSINLESVLVIDAKGAGNLLPHNISGYVARLEKEEAEQILILQILTTMSVLPRQSNELMHDFRIS